MQPGGSWSIKKIWGQSPYSFLSYERTNRQTHIAPYIIIMCKSTAQDVEARRDHEWQAKRALRKSESPSTATFSVRSANGCVVHALDTLILPHQILLVIIRPVMLTAPSICTPKRFIECNNAVSQKVCCVIFNKVYSYFQ